ncbi:hypothetical protein [Dyadobacter koreensis]|uniref:hypothetical protein n=1 Tax=Dyadobacter koreensis TaxID=408657 RepID=UPI000B897579|nr:hypothetical protein [Dyadobacter koreensis]
MKEFKPPYHIARLGETDHKKATIYSDCLIVPTRDGCKVISDENRSTQNESREDFCSDYGQRKYQAMVC